MAPVKVYTSDYCGYCRMAKRLLDAKAVPYEEINVSHDDEARMWLVGASGGRRTVPVIFVGDTCVGGYDELSALERAGQLDELLAA